MQAIGLRVKTRLEYGGSLGKNRQLEMGHIVPDQAILGSSKLRRNFSLFHILRSERSADRVLAHDVDQPKGIAPPGRGWRRAGLRFAQRRREQRILGMLAPCSVVV